MQIFLSTEVDASVCVFLQCFWFGSVEAIRSTLEHKILGFGCQRIEKSGTIFQKMISPQILHLLVEFTNLCY